MRAVDYVRSVRHTLASNRLRAALTLLGTVIGAGSIVFLAGLLRSGEEMLVYSSQSASESDLLRVNTETAALTGADHVRRELSRLDEDLIADNEVLDHAGVTASSSVEFPAEPVTTNGLQASSEKDYPVRVVSSAPDTLTLYRLEIAQGRALNQDDLFERRRVCVVGWETWRHFFGTETKLSDQRLRVQNHEWTIVGVLKSKPLLGGFEGGTWAWNRKMLVPETTYDAMLRPDHTIDILYVRFKHSPQLSSKLKLARKLITQILRRAHNSQNFKIENRNDSEGQEQLVLSIIKGLLLSTALLSLFVGGINIMNIMLVTVTERTREIGVRRAIGATPRAISIQFLLEAVFIAGVGGLIGVASGVGLTWLTSKLLSSGGGSFAFHVETWSLALGFGLSLVTGAIFGLFPAVRAARLDPVEALRFE